MKTAIPLFLLGLFAFAAFAADVDGKWTAQVAGRDGQSQELTFTFKAEGDKLTGTIANARGSRDISDGKIKGDKISFAVTMGEIKILHTGKVSGDQIKFERSREGGQQSQQFVAKKQP